MRYRTFPAVTVVLAVFLAACAVEPAEDAAPPVQEQEQALELELFAPVEGAVAFDQDPVTGAIFVASVSGPVTRLDPADPAAGEVVLDLSDRVAQGFEQGLLGLAVSNDGEHLYLNYTAVGNTSHVVELTLVDGVPDPANERELLTLDQPDITHNGGHLVIDEDDLLWIGFGDGAARNQLVPGTSENAQDLTTLHGSILRIDPRGDPYGIPEDNPFVGVDGARDEIWAYGLRNPWRFGFDPANGDLWIADVGESDREELNRSPAATGRGRGANFGWDTWEGTLRYEGPEIDGDHVAPVFELHHDDGYCAIIGGPTYRGDLLDDLDGWTLFSDVCDPRIKAVRLGDGDVAEARDLGVELPGVVAFGVDLEGEVYALSMLTGVYRITSRS